MVVSPDVAAEWKDKKRETTFLSFPFALSSVTPSRPLADICPRERRGQAVAEPSSDGASGVSSAGPPWIRRLKVSQVAQTSSASMV